VVLGWGSTGATLTFIFLQPAFFYCKTYETGYENHMGEYFKYLNVKKKKSDLGEGVLTLGPKSQLRNSTIL
jgi:hypothetical protein